MQTMCQQAKCKVYQNEALLTIIGKIPKRIVPAEFGHPDVNRSETGTKQKFNKLGNQKRAEIKVRKSQKRAYGLRADKASYYSSALCTSLYFMTALNCVHCLSVTDNCRRGQLARFPAAAAAGAPVVVVGRSGMEIESKQVQRAEKCLPLDSRVRQSESDKIPSICVTMASPTIR